MITIEESLEPIQKAFNKSPGTNKFITIISPT
jgi:hypothetical protein